MSVAGAADRRGRGGGGGGGRRGRRAGLPSTAFAAAAGFTIGCERLHGGSEGDGMGRGGQEFVVVGRGRADGRRRRDDDVTRRAWPSCPRHTEDLKVVRQEPLVVSYPTILSFLRLHCFVPSLKRKSFFPAMHAHCPTIGPSTARQPRLRCTASDETSRAPEAGFHAEVGPAPAANPWWRAEGLGASRGGGPSRGRSGGEPQAGLVDRASRHYFGRPDKLLSV